MVLGLTGSIGMGKSTTAAMFADLGVPVWDADAAVHRVYAPGGPAAGALREIVPEAITPGDGVDRTAMKRAIAADSTLLSRIEAAVHPLVAADRQRFLQENASAALVLLDIPLLFETGAEGWIDSVVVVSTDPEEQRRRVLSRPGMDEDTFRRLLDRQVPDDLKRAKADYIIRTDDLATARQAVEQLVAKLKAEGPGHA
ncbi:dephospho-CoA kinase [Roseibacterium sp. SDUM158017]|nr:dephospho-CoA kinase [Roseibacterium sp. SDUM158017]MDG4646958.1 dephospho-CoA kinase [Roseibacterium sp. SDUM158017]